MSSSAPDGSGRFSRYRALVPQMIKREISERYKGSILGVLWSFITPLILLGIYTFVFGTLFNSRWTGEATTADFAVILFAGLLMFQLFSDVVSRAPSLILHNTNFVKKIVFPLEVLIPVQLGSAMFHALISILILLVAVFFVQGYVPLTIFWLPVILTPFALMMLGFGWFFAAFGVYVRDVDQVIGTALTALLFLAPIFYPPDVIPEWIAPYIYLNPIVVPIELLRDIAIFGKPPSLYLWSIYSAISLVIAALGLGFFQKTRGGFADVL